MKTLSLVLAFVPTATLFGYQYFYTETFGADGLTTTTRAVWLYPGLLPSNGRYEIKSTIALAGWPGATYVQYIAASDSGHYDYAAADGLQYYGVRFESCSIGVYKQQLVDNGDGTWYRQRTYFAFGSGVATCPDNSTVRTLYSGAAGTAGNLTVFINDQLVLQVSLPDVLSGQTGIEIVAPGGGYSGKISRVDLGPWDNVAPNPVNPASVGISAYESRVDIQWQPTTDDANGTGIYSYTVLRNGAVLGTVLASGSLSFSDLAVFPGTTYTYAITATDFHQNVSSQTSFNVTIPASHVNHTIATPPARIGIRPTGAYWGAAGEQIDTLSGNLNWTLPLLKAMGRGGSSFGFSLNYNSQMWRLDSGGTRLAPHGRIDCPLLVGPVHDPSLYLH